MKPATFDPLFADAPVYPQFVRSPAPMTFWTLRFRLFKRGVDLLFCALTAPIVATLALTLFLVNPFCNPGPVFFRQERMGMGGVRFQLWKFRTMLPAPQTLRAHDAPLERDRITPLGKVLRRTRLDELPNFINILRGEMTLVGPRPDAWEHAIRYIHTVPYYGDRFRVRPGITGLAQVRSGYADSLHGVRRKARLDRYYVRKSRMLLDLKILATTVRVLVTGFGAR